MLVRLPLTMLRFEARSLQASARCSRQAQLVLEAVHVSS